MASLRIVFYKGLGGVLVLSGLLKIKLHVVRPFIIFKYIWAHNSTRPPLWGWIPRPLPDPGPVAIGART